MNHRKTKAQAATELAVFGAILIFVAGGILRSAADAGMAQNAGLKAMRWALLQSLYGIGNVDKSRTSASVFFIEDRLSAEAGKFGSMERVPSIQAASGTFSNTLFLPMDWLEYQNISVMDVFVNGDHFVFSTGRFIVYDVQDDPLDPSMVRVWDLTNNIKKSYPKTVNWIENCATVFLPSELEPCTGNPAIDPSIDPANCSTPPRSPPYCGLTPIVYPSSCQRYAGHVVGCPLAYTVVPTNSSKFCDGATPCTDPSPLTIDQRFDLNRNGYSASEDPSTSTQREKMMWQWTAAKGLTSEPQLAVNSYDGIYPSLDIDGDRKEEVIYGVNQDACAMSVAVAGKPPLIHPSICATGTFNGCTNSTTSCPNIPPILHKEVAQRFFVLDFQKGDMDQTFDDWDRLQSGAANRGMGLQKDVSVYTLTKDGTYLEIKEGKAYLPGTNNFVSSANRRNQVDVISRMFQLSADTGRYCTASQTALATIAGVPGGLPNPVEACVNSRINANSNCYTPITVSQTCLDQGTNMLFIRSRIEDTRGRKWVTRTK